MATPIRLTSSRLAAGFTAVRRPRLGDRELVVIKTAAAVLLAAAALGLPSLRAGHSLELPQRGIALACPAGWHPVQDLVCRLEIREIRERGAPGRPLDRACRVTLMRVTWEDFEEILWVVCPRQARELRRDDAASALGAAAAYLGIAPEDVRARRTTLDGRPALEIVAACRDGWAAAVVAAGVDVVVMDLLAPSELDLRRVQPQWKRMVRGARLTEPGCVAPIRW